MHHGTYASSGATFGVVVSFENDGDVKLGMSASCLITVQELTDIVVVPIEAVESKDGKKYVTVIENGNEKEVEIQTGISDDENVQVTEGLLEGDIIKIVTTTTESTIRSSTNGNSDQMNGGNGRKRRFF